MKLTVRRLELTGQSTIGRLAVDGVDFCWTLEDVVRAGPKVPGQTAIPAGTYAVQLTMSNRFKRVLPLLLNVPGFEGVRIHPGNTAADTEGCILVGLGHVDDGITDSRKAFDALFARLQATDARGESISLEIA